MSRRTINNYVILLEKERKIGCTILTESCSTNNSGLTDPESNGSNDVALLGVTDPETTELDGTVASNPSSIVNASAYSNNNSDSENERPFALGGHPKGSTNASALDLQNRIEGAMEDAARELEKVQASAKVTNKRLKKGALTEIISDCRKKHGLGEILPSSKIEKKHLKWHQGNKITNSGHRALHCFTHHPTGQHTGPHYSKARATVVQLYYQRNEV
jgi:hypothetical protein